MSPFMTPLSFRARRLGFPLQACTLVILDNGRSDPRAQHLHLVSPSLFDDDRCVTELDPCVLRVEYLPNRNCISVGSTPYMKDLVCPDFFFSQTSTSVSTKHLNSLRKSSSLPFTTG